MMSSLQSSKKIQEILELWVVLSFLILFAFAGLDEFA
jgi:hypothetical protein